LDRNGYIFDAGVVAGCELGEAGNAEAGVFRRVGLCPGGQIFQRFDDGEAVRVGLDGMAPDNLQLPDFAAVSEDIGSGFSLRDRQGPAGIAGVVPESFSQFDRSFLC
jgi:hypothetical protein